MTAGAGVDVLAVVVIASAPNLVVFLLGWIVAGVAMSLRTGCSPGA